MAAKQISEKEESAIAEKWLHWCRHHKYIKCVEFPVPDGILPKNYKGILIDVKVFGKRRVPDDLIYSAHEDLRQKVARGNCVLELTHLNELGVTVKQYYFLIFALRKFSGGMGDEDESSSACQNLWQNYFIKPLESADKVVVTGKANGEAGHLSCRQIAGETYFCLGSKNVHLLARNSGDLAQYKDSRFEFAQVVAKSFFQSYLESPNTSADQRDQLIAYLQSTKYTTVMEVLQPANQHIEDLSYLTEPQLQFICWTDMYSDDDCNSLCSKPPNESIDKARDFGLTTISYFVIPASEALDYMIKIRGEIEYEGKVLYFLDPEENVFGVLKKKTAWYIILRALREKACSMGLKSSSSSEIDKKVTKRIAEIQTWLEFSDEYRQSWTKLGTGFVNWLIHRSNRQPASKTLPIRAKFPQFWKEFLETHEEMNDIYKNLKYS